jgi:hypothetical protein
MNTSIVPHLHPIDRALAAISEAVAELLTSGRPSRFSEIHTLTRIAFDLQRLRPASGVEGVPLLRDGDDDDVGYPRPIRRFNEAFDFNREILAMAQGFLKNYLDVEKSKASKPAPDVRLGEAAELSQLTELRLRLMKEEQPVPEPISARIDQLLQRIGEPPHEPEPSTVVSAESVRRHPPDGAGQLDGDRVGEPVAERAGGALDAG